VRDRLYLGSVWSWIGAWLIAALAIPMGILLPADLAIWILPVLIVPLACLVDFCAGPEGLPTHALGRFLARSKSQQRASRGRCRSGPSRVNRPTSSTGADVHGELTFFEIGVPDSDRAQAFYAQLFGWEFPPTGEGDQVSVKTPTIKAGLHDHDDDARIGIYFSVDESRRPWPPYEISVVALRIRGPRSRGSAGSRLAPTTKA
jgi:Bleomycin resistance protein-like N-terminal